MIRNKKVRLIVLVLAVIISSFLQTFALQTFVSPAGMLSSGFTGVAILIERITSLYGYSFSVSLGMILLNIPVALICYRHIGKVFVVSSLCQVFLTSFLLEVCTFSLVFEDILLNVIFGGFIYGFSIVIALKGNSSTAGTDFIALYISNIKGKSIFEYVFAFNAIILCIFGLLFGWEAAGYSIIFQYISTKTISTFYQRYKRVTMQITTRYPKEIVEKYIDVYHHGISVMDGYGGYSKQSMSLLHTVVSAYELQDIIQLLHSIDNKVIVNVLPTENFIGGFYRDPID